MSSKAGAFLLHGDSGLRDQVTTLRSPYDGRVIGEVCYADEAAAEHACALAAQAFAQTRLLSSRERAAILTRVADKLIAETQALAEIVVSEAGKPIVDARNEVVRAAETFRVAAEEARRIGGEITPADLTAGNEGRMAFTRRFPIGPILGITPFNFPVNLVAHKVAPALASGNPIIVKPAPQTPLTALWLGRAVVESGWPAGAISVLPCSNEVAAKMVSDRRIAMLSFTGSASIGWMLRKQAATPRVTLELGGNAAVIVCADADLGKAITKIVAGGFTYAGQSCISVQRVYVHRSLKDRLIAGLVAGVGALKCGDPADATTRLGPMINEIAAARVKAWIDEAVKLGATLHAGGGRNGTMVQATVLSGVPAAAKLSCEEAFAPVVVVEAFDDFDQVLQVVNGSRYGLQAALFTSDWKTMTKAWNELEVGAILVDESSAWRAEHLPYGGVKDSGYGKEGVRSTILEMTEPRMLIVPLRYS